MSEPEKCIFWTAPRWICFPRRSRNSWKGSVWKSATASASVSPWKTCCCGSANIIKNPCPARWSSAAGSGALISASATAARCTIPRPATTAKTSSAAACWWTWASRRSGAARATRTTSPCGSTRSTVSPRSTCRWASLPASSSDLSAFCFRRTSERTSTQTSCPSSSTRF